MKHLAWFGIAGLFLLSACASAPEPVTELETCEAEPTNFDTSEAALMAREAENQRRNAELGNLPADHPDYVPPWKPISFPVPIYPTCAAVMGIEGSCAVHFTIASDGHPTDILPVCTNAHFEASAARSVARVEFEPTPANPDRKPRYGIVYPIEFGLDN